MSEFPYKTISVAGPDAFAFLQAQLAADLDVPDSGRAPLLAAWCNPKGRVICVFRVRRSDGAFRLALPAELAEEALARLTRFRFRSKVEFSIEDTSTEDLGADLDYEAWRLQNLHDGIPEILGSQSEAFTPHMLNLDLIGAVSVTKGCYPGQEIVARTHFRGATKRRCLRFTSAAPVAPGNKVSDGDRDVGEVLNAIGRDVLAVVPLTKLNQQLSVNGSALLNLPLPYFE